ncbi:Protein of unknown function [Lactobacillus helveticus CIRM-BIA 951]|uniref:Uncharacterized protein n=1 Tax=Lactobacillus helveticus CIRM-BIA 951 TaxID=1226334 RepID=U6F0Z6_LACHE|nr:Protein of unknown function [Lactobacillus helveticus CIRM-BIA 951]
MNRSVVDLTLDEYLLEYHLAF